MANRSVQPTDGAVTAAGEFIIHQGNYQLFVGDPVVDGERKARGLVPRNYATHPQGCYANAPAIDTSFPLVPDSDLSFRIADATKEGSRISDCRNRGFMGKPIPSRDQNGKGYCWFHSGTGAVLLLRAIMGEPYVDLSAYAGACVIKNFRDEGGWGAEGVDFLTERGVPSSEFWAQRSMARANDNAKTWENAALHRVTEGFWDLHAAQYDRKLSFQQVCTLLLSGIPVVGDFNWWGHSVCLMDVVDGKAQRSYTRVDSGKLAATHEFDLIWGMNDPVTGGYGILILNSWGDSWSQNGAGVLTGSKAVPDGAVAPRAVLASAA